MDAILDTAGSGPGTDTATPWHDPDAGSGPGAASGPGPDLGDLYPQLCHELCRPLIKIRDGCDLLLAGPDGPKGEGQAVHVRALRLQCDDLIRRTRSYLIDYAQPTGSKRDPVPIPFRLGALLREADRQFRARAEAAGNRWSCRVDGGDGLVSTDLAWFQRLVACLVDNAINHTPAGGSVALVGTIEPGHWTIEVSDDGRGIPGAAIERVLEPLVRLSAGREGATAGASPGIGHGMGLAVCRDLVGRLGGTLTLRSRPDTGTSALVRFPREARPGDG